MAIIKAIIRYFQSLKSPMKDPYDNGRNRANASEEVKKNEYVQVSQENNNQYLENVNNGRKLGGNSPAQRQELEKTFFH